MVREDREERVWRDALTRVRPERSDRERITEESGASSWSPLTTMGPLTDLHHQSKLEEHRAQEIEQVAEEVQTKSSG